MRYNFRGVVADPEECEMEDLTELKNLEDDLEGPVLAVFCVATYGEGDPTDNAQAFFDWLQEGTATVNGKNFNEKCQNNNFYSVNMGKIDFT